MATKINNVSQDSLANIARKLGGKLWQKNGHIRIYVGGGNNYHYDGGWYYDIGDKGYWEARCYLTRGYGNKNREAYVNKSGVINYQCELFPNVPVL
jgi:hypothetical protein